MHKVNVDMHVPIDQILTTISFDIGTVPLPFWERVPEGRVRENQTKAPFSCNSE